MVDSTLIGFLHYSFFLINESFAFSFGLIYVLGRLELK